MRPLIRPAVLGVVVLGGMLGVALRAALTPWPGDLASVVLATLAINVAGSGLLGIVVGWLGDRRPLTRAFLGTGVLGGFTTYSAFAVHTVAVGSAVTLDGYEPWMLWALLLVACSLAGGAAAAAAGLWIGDRLSGARPGDVAEPTT
ncbi:fluoride efflux transporter FluC [Microbacterium terricola]|uniref:Fluoride-specific ion channel FluC n=1 Tax=Microbacterium terricola TaxID=344163 RepID=A0ABM8DV51_9MICO|nr:CrcB family protein [Microbacterium terricola]UYK39774.1 CrcB family protein [Microbacterium terricola]BDV29475.1 hypothetical protein Microterr_01350 [Microbacterium terricola]